jgi:acetyl esterase/lipase
MPAYAGRLATRRRWGVEPSRIAVMGDSVGGGIAAGVALLARSRGLLLALQILI